MALPFPCSTVATGVRTSKWSTSGRKTFGTGEKVAFRMRDA
jgi:hypothetical protein